MDSRGRPPKSKRSITGARIAQARKNAGLSQEELANELGVTQQTIVALERRSSNIQANTLVKLAKILRVSTDSLLGLQAPPPKEEIPGGRCRKTFNRVSKLPRRQQEKIIEVVNALVSQSLANSEKTS